MIKVKSHPLIEVIAKKLLGIESVPLTEQQKMVSRACKAAVIWHVEETKKLEARISELENTISIPVITVDEEADRRIEEYFAKRHKVMSKATAVQMRKALEAVNAFKQAGIEFIPMPVLDDEDRAKLAEDVFKRLSIIERQADKGGK